MGPGCRRLFNHGKQGKSVRHIGAMEELITHCATNSPTTKMIFTTGPVDIPAGEWTGECGYEGHLKHVALYVIM